jgi:hypothetical protein
MVISPQLLSAYQASVVEVVLPTHVFQAGPSQAEYSSPYPEKLRPFCWVITAHNPGSVVCSTIDNTAKNIRLLADLSRTGCVHFEAFGRSADGTWKEPSFAVVGVGEGLILDLAKKYGQLGLFKLEPNGVHVVLVDAP